MTQLSVSSEKTTHPRILLLPGAVVGVLHVGHTHGGVTDPVVHHRVHRDRHTVLGQHLIHRDNCRKVGLISVDMRILFKSKCNCKFFKVSTNHFIRNLNGKS